MQWYTHFSYYIFAPLLPNIDCGYLLEENYQKFSFFYNLGKISILNGHVLVIIIGLASCYLEQEI